MALHPKYNMELWQADLDLLLVAKCNFCSISHRFQFISDYLQTGNNVIPFSMVGGVAPQIQVGILKGRPDLLVMLKL